MVLGNVLVVLGKFCVVGGIFGVCSGIFGVSLGSILEFHFLTVMISLRFLGGSGGFQVATSSGKTFVLRAGMKFVLSVALLGLGAGSFGKF